MTVNPPPTGRADFITAMAELVADATVDRLLWGDCVDPADRERTIHQHWNHLIRDDPQILGQARNVPLLRRAENLEPR